MNFRISLAGTVIEINSIYDRIYRMCVDYLSEGTPDITITVTQEDLNAEHGHPEVGNHSDAYLETLAVYRKIANALPFQNAFLMHGSVVALNNSAYLITAESGVGKTTRTKLWLENIPGSYVVNGDKPLILADGNGVSVCGTPWAGKEGWQKNCIVSLKAVYLLERSETNRITEISFAEAFPRLYRQTYHSRDAAAMKQILMLLMRLNGSVRFFRMQTNREPEGVLQAYEAAGGVLGRG